MKMRLPIAFVLAGCLGAGGFSLAFNASAQQSTPNNDSTSPYKMQMHDHGDDHGRWGAFSAADRAAFFDARIAAMHAGLTLTPDQDKLWPAVETALRDAAKTMVERREMWKDQPHPADPVQMLQRISEGSLARGEALKKLADAAAPLYAALNDEQKHRLPILLAHLHPHGMRFAMMDGEHRFGPEGGERGWDHGHRDHDGDRGDNKGRGQSDD
jgi:hypothetical protein